MSGTPAVKSLYASITKNKVATLTKKTSGKEEVRDAAQNPPPGEKGVIVAALGKRARIQRAIGQLRPYPRNPSKEDRDLIEGERQGVGILPTLVAKAVNAADKSTAVFARVLVDTGAQSCLITSRLADQLGLECHPVDVSITGVGGEVQEVPGVAKFLLRSVFTNYELPVHAIVLPRMLGRCKSLAFHPLKRYPSMKKLAEKIPLADHWPQPEGVEFDIILGQDHMWTVLSGKVHWPSEVKGTRGPVFIETPFGLVLQGFEREPGPGVQILMHPAREQIAFATMECVGIDGIEGTGVTSLKVPKTVSVDKAQKEEALDRALRRLWSWDNIGVVPPTQHLEMSASEAYAVKYLEENLEFLEKEKKFRVKIPFNPKSPPLKDNFNQAKQRLQSLMNHLSRNEMKKQLYDEAMKKYLESNHAQLLEEEDADAGEVFYLPHSGVLTQKTGGWKLRIVFDCSAKDPGGQSLNDKMLTGPVPDANLVRILTQWRKHPYAFAADVKDCFLSILVHPADQNKFRFLWYDEEGRVVVYKFTSLIFGSKASPWISSTCLFKTLDRFVEAEPALVERIKRSIWVDDVLLSAPSIKEAQEAIVKMEKMFITSSFKMAKFAASHDEILEKLPADKLLFQKGEKKGTLEITKALGVSWNLEDDTLFVGQNIEEAFQRKKPYDTKRSVASMVAKIYDPLSILLPWKIGGLILLKDIWQHQQEEATKRGISKTAKLFWDEPLPVGIQTQVEEWKTSYPLAATIKLPRSLVRVGEIKSQELYGFSDASPLAFGAAIYLKTNYRKGPPTCRFMLARGKVNPPVAHNLPRCELIATKFLAQMVEAEREYLEQKLPCTLFSDSMVALCWIKHQDSQRWKVMVANAVKAIRMFTETEDWHHIPGEINPADLLTRPHPLEELKERSDWFEGPEFCVSGEFPTQPEFYSVPAEAEVEEKKKPEEANATVLAAVAKSIQKKGPANPISRLEERKSRFITILRIIAWAKRCYRKDRKEDPVFNDRQEIWDAIKVIIKYVQHTSFAEELKALAQKQGVKPSSKLAGIDPFVDPEGFLRAQGRTGRGELHKTYEAKYPYVLPSDSKLVEGLAVYIHEEASHATIDTMHSEIRKRFWILGGRKTLMKFRSKCIQCKRHDGRPMSQQMAPLPPERLDVEAPPYTHIAIDGLGPIYTKDFETQISAPPEGSKRKRDIVEQIEVREKTWVLVICCMTTRAINCELLESLEAVSFVTALRRHFADFGLAATVRLDNLHSHQRMHDEFEGLLSLEMLDGAKQAFRHKGIKFSWSSVGQPSTNGVVERCVQIVKKTMLKALGKDFLTRGEVHTFLKEARAIINSRPLTQVHQTEVGDQMAITPNHLIFGHGLGSLPFAEDATPADKRQDWAAMWRDRQQQAVEFRKLFIDQYIQSLRATKKWKQETSSAKVGDLCLVIEPNVKRRDWPLAVVEEIIASKGDGLIRTVRLRMRNKIVVRSVHSLIFLRHLEGYTPSQEHGIEPRAEEEREEEDISGIPMDTGDAAAAPTILGLLKRASQTTVAAGLALLLPSKKGRKAKRVSFSPTPN